MCGRKAVVAFNVTHPYGGEDRKCVYSLCAIHAPKQFEGSATRTAIQNCISYPRDISNIEQISIDSVKDIKVKDQLERWVLQFIRIMNVKHAHNLTDDQWKIAFELALKERKIKNVLNS